MSEGNFDRPERHSRLPNSRDLETRACGTVYKSEGEKKIAGLLNQYGIPFIYEKPVAVEDAGHTKIWYPDFYLFCGTVIEYFGINGNQDYRKRTQHKLRVYAQNKVNVIPVYPQDLKGGWQERLIDRIDRSLEKLLSCYRMKVEQRYEKAGQAPYRLYAGLR